MITNIDAPSQTPLSPSDPTIGHPARVALLAWAEANEVSLPLHWFLYLLRVRTRRHWDFIATAMDSLAACDSHLQRWHRREVPTWQLAALANAWVQRRPDNFRYSRGIAHPPTKEFSEKGAAAKDYLYLLFQCQRPVGADTEPQLAMRSWLLIKGMAFAQRGNVADALLRQACINLRMAAYEKQRDWSEVFATMTGFTNNPHMLEGRIRDAALPGLVASRLHTPELQPKHTALLDALRMLSIGRDRPDDVLDDADQKHAWPVPSTISMDTPPRRSEPTSDIEDEDEDDDPQEDLFVASADDSSDESDVNIIAARQDIDSSPGEQDEATRTIHLLGNADARFLAWDWNRPSPPERVALDELIERTLATPQPSLDHMTAALATVALVTGQSLPVVLRMPISPDRPLNHGIWSIDIPAGQLIQRAPRRDAHWTPPEGKVLPIRGWQNELTWSLPPQVAQVLAQAYATFPNATLVGQLWAGQSGSCLTAFNRWVKANHSTSRLSTGSLAMDLGVRIYLSSGDPVLARLASAQSFAGMPGSTAYAAYTVATLAQHHPLLCAVADLNANAAGSLLDTIDDRLLGAAFRGLHSRLVDAAAGDDAVEWHNLLALYWDARLRAATGARPIGSMWSVAGDFDWERGFCYVDEKNSPHTPSGRLTPLPTDLLQEFRTTYREEHLPWLRRSLATRLVWSPDSPSLLFVLKREGERLRPVPITHAHREHLGLERPLPSNLMRHRLRIWLHRNGGDPEVIDSLLGHHDGATLTHGGYSMRVWLKDAQAIRPILAAALDALDIPSPPRRAVTAIDSPGPAAIESGQPSDALVADTSSARSATQRRWRREGFALVKDHLRQQLAAAFVPITGAHSLLDQLGSLNERQMDELAQKLSRTGKGLPATAGITRFEVLQRLAVCSWRYKRRPLNLSKRYFLEAQEPSPFNSLAPAAGSLRLRLATVLDDAFRAEPHLSKISAKAASLLVVVDIAVTSGATHPKMLRAVLQSNEQLRLVTIADVPYLEWAPQTSLVERPEAAVQRFRISRRAAMLIGRLLQSNTRAVQHDDPSLPLRQRICEVLGLAKTAPFNSWLDAVCTVVRQDNAIALPGTVAAFLDGRVMTASLDQSDWITLRTGNRRVAPWQELAATNGSSLYEGVLSSAPPLDKTLSPLVIKDFQRHAADDFVRLVRKYMREIDGLGTRQRRAIKVDELESAIDDFVQQSKGYLSGAVRMLGLWAVHLLRLKRANGYAQILGDSARRYIDALAPQFRELAYNVELSQLGGDELGDLYRKIVQTSTVKDRRFLFERLRQFHHFVYSAFAVDDCDWSSVAPAESSLLGAPGLIDDPLYHETLLLSASTTPPAGITTWQCSAFLVLARRFGLRGGEVLGLNLDDLQGWPNAPAIAVRRRVGTRIKSPAAKRLVPLLFALEDHERVALERLLAHHAGASVGIENPPLLGDPGDPRKRLDIAVVQPHLNRLLRAAAGRKGLTVHDLRHSFANAVWAATEGFEYVPTWFAARLPMNIEAVRNTLLGRKIETPSRRGMWAIERLLGHVHPSVGLRSYVHLVPEIAEQLRYCAEAWEPRWALQPLGNVTPLENLPQAQPLPACSLQPYEPLTPSLALEAMKLIPARGVRATEATIGLSDGALDVLAALVNGVEARLRLSATQPDETSNVIEPGRTSGAPRSQHARAAAQGMLASVRRSAYARIRAGLRDSASPLVRAAEELSGHSIDECYSMVGPVGELSVWTSDQLNLVSALLRLAVADGSRVTLRAPASHIEWAEQAARKLPWPLPVSRSSQVPAVYLEASGAVQQRRLVILVDDGATGFTFNRSELITSFICVISCTNLRPS